MSKKTLPRHTLSAIGGVCWAEHSITHYHCTLPAGHGGGHWHAYSKTSW